MGFDYAITFLEISFVVLVRKLIPLENKSIWKQCFIGFRIYHQYFCFKCLYKYFKKEMGKWKVAKKKEIEDNIRLI